MSNSSTEETPEQIWNKVLSSLILEPELKLELEHDFDSIFGAWAKPSTGNLGNTEEVAAAPAFALLTRLLKIAQEEQQKSFNWQNWLIEAQKQIPVMQTGVNPNQRADGSTQDHHTTMSGHNSRPSHQPYVKIPPGKPPTVEQVPALQRLRLNAKIAESKRMQAQKITSTEEILPINSPVWVLAGNRKKLDSVHRGPGRVIKHRPKRNTYLVQFQGPNAPIVKKYHQAQLRLSKNEHLSRLVPTTVQLQAHQAAAVKTKPPPDAPLPLE